jgi:hypothetical protein
LQEFAVEFTKRYLKRYLAHPVDVPVESIIGKKHYYVRMKLGLNKKAMMTSGWAKAVSALRIEEEDYASSASPSIGKVGYSYSSIHFTHESQLVS